MPHPGLPHLIEVRVDPDMHCRAPSGEAERQVWAALDTAHHLFAEAAVKLALMTLREQFPKFPATDAEMFRIFAASGDPDAPTGYRDLEPDSHECSEALHEAFRRFVKQVEVEMAEGFDA